MHILLKANHENKRRQGIEIKPWQLITSMQSLSAEIWLSSQQLKTAIKRLKSTNEITIETTTRYTQITLVRWESYQHEKEATTNNITNGATNEQQTNNKRATTTKECNNDNKDNNTKESKKKIARDAINKKIIKIQEDKEFMNYAEKVFNGWNKQKIFKKCRALTPKILIALKNVINDNGKDSIRIAFINYSTDIVNRRDPEHSHYKHRYSLFEFLVNEWIFDRFYNQ